MTKKLPLNKLPEIGITVSSVFRRPEPENSPCSMENVLAWKKTFIFTQKTLWNLWARPCVVSKARQRKEHEALNALSNKPRDQGEDGDHAEENEWETSQ